MVSCLDRAQHTATRDGDDLVMEGPEGHDLLRHVEFVHFADGLYDAGSLAP